MLGTKLQQPRKCLSALVALRSVYCASAVWCLLSSKGTVFASLPIPGVHIHVCVERTELRPPKLQQEGMDAPPKVELPANHAKLVDNTLFGGRLNGSVVCVLSKSFTPAAAGRRGRAAR